MIGLIKEKKVKGEKKEGEKKEKKIEKLIDCKIIKNGK